MVQEKYLEHEPKIAGKTYIADSAVIVGMVEIGENSSVWPNVTMRGDVNYIKMGKFSNVQDGSVVHVAAQPCPTIIGDYVTIGHGAIVHACVIEDNCLIGMGSVILDGAIIGHGRSLAPARWCRPARSSRRIPRLWAYPAKSWPS